MPRYFFLANKLNHQSVITLISKYYPNETWVTNSDFPIGFTCKFNNGIKFELNKYDKDITFNGMGEDRVKIAKYSKNGYILTLPKPHLILIHKLKASLIEG